MKHSGFTLSFLIFLIGWQVLGQEEKSGIRAGPTLAVLEANIKDGFRLSEKAKKVIGLVTKPLGSKPYIIPPNAIVNYGDRVGVYRLRNGWFKLIEIRNSEGLKSSVAINNADLKNDDQVAVEGVALLRVSEMDAFGSAQ